MGKKRICQCCGQSENMVRVIDAVYEVYDTRHRICFECAFTLDQTDDNDLIYHQEDTVSE